MAKDFKVIGFTQKDLVVIGVFNSVEGAIDAGENFWQNNQDFHYHVETTEGELVLERYSDMEYSIYSEDEFYNISDKFNQVSYIHNKFTEC